MFLFYIFYVTELVHFRRIIETTIDILHLVEAATDFHNLVFGYRTFSK